MSSQGNPTALARIKSAAQSRAPDLDLSGLGLKAVPEALAGLSALQRLDLSSNQLQELPAFVFRLPTLTELDAGNNRLADMPPEVGEASGLTLLDLSENRLTRLPPQLGLLASLRSLHLSANRLVGLPPSLTELGGLVSLDLALNSLATLPELDARLANLQRLDLSHNQLQSVPRGLSRLPRLTWLNLGHNRLGALGPEVAVMFGLQELYLDHNQLAALPLDQSARSRLRIFSVDGNPLSGQPGPLQQTETRQRSRIEQTLGEFIYTESRRDEHYIVTPDVVFGFLLAIGTLGGLLSALDLYYKRFRGDASVKLVYPNGTELQLRRLSRKKAMKIARQHEQELESRKALVDLGSASSGDPSQVNVLRTFAGDILLRVPGVEVWPKRPGAERLQFSTAPPPDSAAAEGVPEMLTILFLAADPTDAARLRLGEESREIQTKLQLARLRDRFQYEQRWSVRPEDLSQALLDVQPQIVHFSGHGGSAGAIYLEDKQGRSQPVDPEALAALFALVAGHVQCVILNACYSQAQASAISQHIPYVVGMSNAVGDQAAIAFAVGFYQALGAGRSVEDAYRFGVVQIQLQGIPEHLTPVLVKKQPDVTS